MSETTEQRSMTMTETIGDILGRQLPQFERVRQYIETELADNETALRTKLKAKDAEIASITEQRDKAWACAEHREHNINTEKRLEAKINAKEEECLDLGREVDEHICALDLAKARIRAKEEECEGYRDALELWVSGSKCRNRMHTLDEDCGNCHWCVNKQALTRKPTTAEERAEIKKGVIKQSEYQ